MAVSTLETIYQSGTLSDADRASVQSSLGRVFLQLGDIAAASQRFAEARRMRETGAPPDWLEQHMDEALLAVAKACFIFEHFLGVFFITTPTILTWCVCILS